jgi:hypothetical protein
LVGFGVLVGVAVPVGVSVGVAVLVAVDMGVCVAVAVALAVGTLAVCVAKMLAATRVCCPPGSVGAGAHALSTHTNRETKNETAFPFTCRASFFAKPGRECRCSYQYMLSRRGCPDHELRII